MDREVLISDPTKDEKTVTSHRMTTNLKLTHVLLIHILLTNSENILDESRGTTRRTPILRRKSPEKEEVQSLKVGKY